MLSVYILAGDYAISLAFSVRFNFLNTIGNPAVFKRLEFISWDWQNLPLPRKQPKLPVRQMEGSENIETKLIQLAKWYTQTNYICVQYSAQIFVFNISRTNIKKSILVYYRQKFSFVHLFLSWLFGRVIREQQWKQLASIYTETNFYGNRIT